MKTLYSFSVLRHFVVVFFVGLFLLGAGEVRGTHVAGADLTYTCIAPNQYRIILSVYRDCRGVSLANPQTVTWTAASGTGCSGSLNVIRTSITDITPLPTGVLSRCAGGPIGALGIEKHIFQAVLTIPPGCTGITFAWGHCCRSNAITTLSVPGGDNVFIQAYVDHPICNNSPTFNNTPLLYTCVNQPVNYNLGVTDTDGDSLAYALTPCLEANNNIVDYSASYSGTSFLGVSVPISLNPLTGDLSFTPTSPAVTPICIRVNEYRNGVLIGSTTRDIQYTAYNCTNSPPSLSGINNTNNYNITISNTTNLCFDVHSIDPNGDTISNMGFLNTNFAGATFNATLNNDTVSGTFCWSPSLGDTGIHYLQVYARDNGLPVTLQTVKTYTINIVPDNIFGVVYQDLNSNCIQDANEPGIPNRTITVNPGNIIVNTNGNGIWGFDTLPVGSYTAIVDTSNNWLSTCPIVQNFIVVHPDSNTIASSFGLISGNEPPLLSGIDSSSNYTITVFANHTLCFDVYSIDTNGNAITNMGVVGSLLGASFTSSLSNNTGVGTYCWTPSLNQIGTYTIQIHSQDNGAPIAAQTVKTYTIIVVPGNVYGRAFNDLNSDCIKNNVLPEYALVNQILLIDPGNIVVTTNSEGYWAVDSLPPGNYTLTSDTTSSWVPTCAIVQNFTVAHSDSITAVPFTGYISPLACPKTNAYILPSSLRPGFSNQILYIRFHNSSSTSALANHYTIVEIDPLMTIQGGNCAYTNLGNNQYRIDIPTLFPWQGTLFQLYFHLSSAAVIGQTLCMNAKVYPLDSCSLDNIPNPYAPTNNITPCNLPYDNSSLLVDASCINDTVQFVVHNGGSGNMGCFAPIRVYLDGIWILSDSIQLQAGDSAIFRYSGDGRTWRLEADQHPLPPGNSRPNATIERCGNLANWTPNLVNILPHDDADDFIDINCRLVSMAIDPNDKTGYPLGVGTQHDIQPNQDLEYVINFQNTGNDTAFTVVIRDTLPMDLNIFTVQSGASSHDYTFRMYGPRILEWTFNNIMLPDSNVNEVASHGFTSFSVKQVPNLPVGTVIENSAAIYFDLNAPVITNTSWHTIALPQDLNWAGQQTVNTATCGDYTLNNFTYNASGTYWQALNYGGLDSLYTLNLTIDNQPSDSISLFGTTLTAYTSGISYQWLDCNNGNTPIAGETNQSFTPLLSGDYAVEMTDGACTVVSNCLNVNVISVSNIANDLGVLVYPNPVQSMLYIDKKDNEEIHFQLMDNLGRVLMSNSSNEPISKINLTELAVGVYFLSIDNGKKMMTQKVVKQ